jgi:hypothetical protein
VAPICENREESTYLFEFFNIYVELASKLCFSLRERRHLSAQGSRPRGFIFGCLALLFEPYGIMLNFKLPGTQLGHEM